MTREQRRAAMEDAAYPALKRLPGVTDDLDYADLFDALTAAGFSISLDSVRDHTNCEVCDGSGEADVFDADDRRLIQQPIGVRPCPGGSPVVWSTEP